MSQRQTEPVVARPDSVTHWTCPSAPYAVNATTGERRDTHHISGAIERCTYCHWTTAELRVEQTEEKKLRADWHSEIFAARLSRGAIPLPSFDYFEWKASR